MGVNPWPLVEVWGGPVVGVVVPLLGYLLVRGLEVVAELFGGVFCGVLLVVVVNGVYIGMGVVEGGGGFAGDVAVGDADVGAGGVWDFRGGGWVWVVACDERAVGVWEGERGGERSRTLAGRQCHGEQGGFGLGGGVGGFGDGGGVVGGGAGVMRLRPWRGEERRVAAALKVRGIFWGGVFGGGGLST